MFPKDKEILALAISGSIVGLFIISFVLIVVIRFKIRQQRYLRETESMKAEFQQTLLQAQLEIQEQTFQNISQEIHDNIGQILSLTKLNLNLMAPLCTHISMMGDTQQLIGKAINDLRNLSKSLDSDRIADIDLTESIGHELKMLEKTSLFTTHLEILGNSFPIGKEKKIILFRIFQEILNNILKHAGATKIGVNFEFLPKQFQLTITDNGQGFILGEKQNGLGLRNIRSRSALIGAISQISSSPGNGTAINIILPTV